MRVRRWGPALAGPFAIVALLTSSFAYAHHGAASIYDMSKETTIKATVTEFVWTNPHVELGVSTTGGTKTERLRGLGAPRNTGSGGWSSRAVKAGDVVTVTFHPGLRGAKIGVVMKLITADGKELQAGHGSSSWSRGRP